MIKIKDLKALMTEANLQKVILFDLSTLSQFYCGFLGDYTGYNYEICSIDALFQRTDILTINIETGGINND